MVNKTTQFVKNHLILLLYLRRVVYIISGTGQDRTGQDIFTAKEYDHPALPPALNGQ